MLHRHPEHQYLDLVRRVIDEGDERIDRTGVGTRSVFGAEMRFDLADGFPAMTTKKIPVMVAIKEMLAHLSAATTLREFLALGVKVWTDWPLAKYRQATGDMISQEAFEARILADDEFSAKYGGLGRLYGAQWRGFRGADGREIDQVQQVIDLLRTNPTSRRILWEGWNPAEIDQMALPPCHKTYMFWVDMKRRRLCGHLHQRSCDLGLGFGWNIVGLAVVTHMLAQQVGLTPGEIVWYGADVHVYLNHIEGLKTQLTRDPRAMPTLEIVRHPESLFSYRPDDFKIVGYDPHPPIKLEVAV